METMREKTYWTCTSITLVVLLPYLVFVHSFSFSCCWCAHDFFFLADRCRIPAKLINFQLIPCFSSDNDAYPSLFWRSYRQADPFFSPPPYIIIINDWLHQPFLLWPLGLACYVALCFLLLCDASIRYITFWWWPYRDRWCNVALLLVLLTWTNCLNLI